MAAALEFEGVTKEYRGFFGRKSVRALDDFSLRVEQGEIFGFLGPNGAGKTTAMHLAMGFMRPTAGEGRMLGRPFGDAATRKRVGFLAEHVALYHRPAEKLVRFYGKLNGLRDPGLQRRAREALEAVGLAEEADRNVGRFSRGMLQRVGLAQALVNDPELLLLDEPTAALDPLARIAVRELLLAAQAAGKTVFLSSHLLSEVELISTRVAILHQGRVRRTGTVRELLEARAESEVVARGIDVVAFSGTAAGDGLVTFSVPAEEQRKAIERVWAAGGEVVSVNPVRKTLEEIFVELTREE
ncbi:MAG TPA: ABC transporter ATP-binding protein [Terriglobales bacterium]|nr:ABC transporter ATP-binding protein [Terriglobales bacterium]